MKLPKFEHSKYLHQILCLPRIPQIINDFQTLYCPKSFHAKLLELIAQATKYVCLVALYFEKDAAGTSILHALYKAKKQRPQLKIFVLVDWHRAQRSLIGTDWTNTNADWYCEMAEQNLKISVPIYGVAVNTREALGVFHLKGSIIDDNVIYTGASINDIYLYQNDRYRYDRYQVIKNSILSHVMLRYVEQEILNSSAIQRLDRRDRPKNSEIKNLTKKFRVKLREASYKYINQANNDELAVTPLVGLGKKNLLNKTINDLICSTKKHLIICTPYFNLPSLLVRNISTLLREGKQVEIIVGDKTASDFYIPEDKPFKIIGILPYLYEINLRRFLKNLQCYIDNSQLILRLWKDGNNSYHLKGIWVDNTWQLITGNNLNPRAWNLDLENAILIHDPKQEMQKQQMQELDCIRQYTRIIINYLELETISQYPMKVHKMIRRMRRIRIDRLINHIL